MSKKNLPLVMVRGGGDIATGSITALHKAGFPLIVLEIEAPSAIRRNVALSEAVYEGTWQVEDFTCRLCHTEKEIEAAWEAKEIPLLIDPKGESIAKWKPQVVVDAILAKKNLGTGRQMAPFTVALGPGFAAGEDVDVVIETQRGHNLGRIIYEGMAMPNTGIPGKIAGFDKERVIHSPAEGNIHNFHEVGDFVEQGEVISLIGEEKVYASLTGILRGMIREGYPVTKGFKIADIDPRKEELKNCFTISDKARCIGGSVLIAVMEHLANRD